MWPKTLSIAGFDGSGGAGMQADLKTFSALGCYGMNVLTALPVQNTTGVKACYALPLQSITDQLDAIFSDIPLDAIKIGMLFNADIVEIIANYLAKHAKNIPIIVDPVMVAKSGDRLLLPEAITSLQTQIFPQSTLITPNIAEAETLTGLRADNQEDMLTIASKLLTSTHAVLLKGGHLPGNMAHDLLLIKDQQPIWFSAKKIQTKNTHGTGCTLSAAITAFLARGFDLSESCRLAKIYLTEALQAASQIHIGHDAGPVHHFYHIWN